MTSAQETVHRMRGCAIGVLSACAAVAAHGTAGGSLPDSDSLLLMIAACAVLGAAIGSLRRSPGPAVTLGLLVAGQFLAHMSLTALDGPAMIHHGIASPSPSPSMIAMHLVATLVTAVAIRVGESVLPTLLTAIIALVHPVLVPPANESPRLDRLVPARDVRHDRHTIAPLGTRGPPPMAR
ncbi:hypothetical protein [Gordonia aurantiaca]|uniref:hypothetical protein n=1 Tax=Gordonia sp. B21 TaxID=3151852 RepID=UPI00326724C1